MAHTSNYALQPFARSGCGCPLQPFLSILSLALPHRRTNISQNVILHRRFRTHFSASINIGCSSHQLVKTPVRMTLDFPNIGPALKVDRENIGIQRSQWKKEKLPIGLPVRYIGSKEELLFLYHEIFTDQQYLKEATLGPGDVVLDVGANVGLFSLFAALRCPGGQVVACEPIPATFNALEWNIASLQKNKEQQEIAQVRCLNIGLSNGDLSEAQFTFYEKAPGWSSMAPDEEEMRNAMEIYLDKLLQAPLAKVVTPLRLVGQLLRSTAPEWLFDKASSTFIEGMLGDKTMVTCPLKTVSEVMHEMNLDKVDLLKVDVERAELDVLLGIALSDWPKIRQVAMEVHDVEGGLNKVVELLRYMGFKVVFYECEGMEGTGLHMVHGKREWSV